MLSQSDNERIVTLSEADQLRRFQQCGAAASIFLMHQISLVSLRLNAGRAIPESQRFVVPTPFDDVQILAVRHARLVNEGHLYARVDADVENLEVRTSVEVKNADMLGWLLYMNQYVTGRPVKSLVVPAEHLSVEVGITGVQLAADVVSNGIESILSVPRYEGRTNSPDGLKGIDDSLLPALLNDLNSVLSDRNVVSSDGIAGASFIKNGTLIIRAGSGIVTPRRATEEEDSRWMVFEREGTLEKYLFIWGNCGGFVVAESSTQVNISILPPILFTPHRDSISNLNRLDFFFSNTLMILKDQLLYRGVLKEV